MVRLEKVIYEKAVNGLSRSKAISSPRKWFYANPYEHLRRTTLLTKSTTTTFWDTLSSEKLLLP